MDSRSRTPFGNSPPTKTHVIIPADKLKPGRVIIVGDVHGCLHELNQLLEKCQYQPEKDNLILAGDVVNKGPQSVEALRMARKLGAIVLRGNHEDACLALKKRLSVVASLSSSYKWLKNLTPEDVEYLEELPFTITLPSHHTVIVHAGFVPDGTPVQQQTMKNMLFLEDVELDSADGRKFKCHYKTRQLNKSWARFWQGPCHVFFGHACGEAAQEYQYATGLDTGCVGGGLLTACVLPSAADLQRHPQYQAFLGAVSSGRLQAAPTLAELGATVVQVGKEGPGSTLQSAFSAELSSPDFAHGDAQKPGSMREASSVPTPTVQPAAERKPTLPKAATSHLCELKQRAVSL